MSIEVQLSTRFFSDGNHYYKGHQVRKVYNEYVDSRICKLILTTIKVFKLSFEMNQAREIEVKVEEIFGEEKIEYEWVPSRVYNNNGDRR